MLEGRDFPKDAPRIPGVHRDSKCGLWIQIAGGFVAQHLLSISPFFSFQSGCSRCRRGGGVGSEGWTAPGCCLVRSSRPARASGDGGMIQSVLQGPGCGSLCPSLDRPPEGAWWRSPWGAASVPRIRRALPCPPGTVILQLFRVQPRGPVCLLDPELSSPQMQPQCPLLSGPLSDRPPP